MTETCEYVFSPDDWEDENPSESSVDGVWECPHPTHVDTEYCVFHLLPDRRELLGVTEVDVRDELLRAVDDANSDEERRFIGGNFGELDLSDQIFEEGNVIDLRHATIDGTLDLSRSVVEPELRLGCIGFRDIHAPEAELGGVSFRECTFDGLANFDATEFGGEAVFRHTTFEGNAEFPDAVFEDTADLRYTTYDGREATFSSAVFEGEARISGAEFNQANFTGADFHGRADFSGTRFQGETKFQYSDFDSGVDFESADFTGNSKFRGVDFSGDVVFADCTFRGWSSFRDVEFVNDADFSDAWFKRDLNLVAESSNNAVLDMSGARLGKASFEFDTYSPVFVDLSGARVGNMSLSTKQPEGNPFDHVRFVRTEFKGFDFSKHADELADADYEIHTTSVHGDDDLSLLELEKTYRLAAEGAKGNHDGIASKFSKKESRYRSQRQKGEGNKLASVANYVRSFF